MRKRPTVFGWQSPWSGDEHDKVPRMYHLWFKLYAATRGIRHQLNLHDWDGIVSMDPLRDPKRIGISWYLRCTWCGKTRQIIGR